MDDSIRQLLENPQIFHYKQYWLKVPIGTTEDTLLSIFSFGTYKDSITHKIKLNDLMKQKLQKLTILSLVCDNNNDRDNNIPYSIFLQECEIKDVSILERYLIELQPLVRCRIDQVSQTVNIIKCLDCRDIYCHEKPLLKLNHLPITKDDLIKSLKQWRSKLQDDIS